MLSEGAGANAREGDVVFLRALCEPGSANDATVSNMFRRIDSGDGILVVAALGKGERLPRGWELVLAGVHLARLLLLLAHRHCVLQWVHTLAWWYSMFAVEFIKYLKSWPFSVEP